MLSHNIKPPANVKTPNGLGIYNGVMYSNGEQLAWVVHANFKKLDKSKAQAYHGWNFFYRFEEIEPA